MTDLLDPYLDIYDPEVAGLMDELSLWSSRFGAVLLDRVPLRPDLRVLDVGCGPGFPLFELAHMLGRKARLWAVDPWAEALARCAWKRRLYDLATVTLVRGDAADMPFAADAFDLVVSNLGVNNFADPATTLRECGRCLRPEGRLCLTTNLSGHMAELYEVFDDTLAARGDEAARRRLAEQAAHRGTVDGVQRLLGEAGLEVVEREQWSFVMRYADGGAVLRHSLTRFGFLPAWIEVVEADERPEVFAALEAGLDRLAEREGELRLSVPALYVEARRADSAAA